MKRRKVNSEIERCLLMGLVTSSKFLGTAVNVLDLDLLSPGPFKRIAGWCLDYFSTYSKAPARQIESLYFSWMEKQEDDEKNSEAEAVGKLLDQLSKQYESKGDLNVPYLIDELGKYLSIKKLGRLKDTLEDTLLRGNEREATAAVQGYKTVPCGGEIGVDLGNKLAPWKDAFADPLEPLFSFPGDGGRFLNPALTRDSLIAIQGPEKRGKTWWCLEFAMRALRERRRVAFFSVGDLSLAQLTMRFGMRWASKPLWKTTKVKIPLRISGLEQDIDVDYVSKKYRKLTEQDCLHAVKRFRRGMGMLKGTPYIMVSCHPTGSVNIKGIEGILDGWEVEKGFIPDLVIIDYADILAPENSSKNEQDEINKTWTALRRLSQQRRCLVITPTQADAKSYDMERQTMKNFSRDKRKLAHVTGMLGLNQTDSERERQIMRLNWLVLRESKFDPRQCLYVGQCIPLARAFCCGALLRRGSDNKAMGETGSK